MMKDTAPIGLGVIAVAALFGIVAAGVALVAFGFGLPGAALIGLVIAVLTAVVLLLGWRQPQAGPQATQTAPTTAAPAPVTSEAPAPAPSAAPQPAAAPKPASTEAPATVAKSAAPVAKAPAAKAPAPAAKAKTPAAKAKAPAAKPKASTAKETPVAADGKPAFLSAAREGGPDDLKQIKGIGPKLEMMLHGMGVYHFDQIAGWRAAEQKWVDANLEGFKGRATRDEWVKQAKVLAKGGSTEFANKVKKGGVY